MELWVVDPGVPLPRLRVLELLVRHEDAVGVLVFTADLVVIVSREALRQLLDKVEDLLVPRHVLHRQGGSCRGGKGKKRKKKRRKKK